MNHGTENSTARIPRRDLPAAIVISFLLFAHPVMAGKILDYLRNYDLNDYALGVSITGSQNMYLGADSSSYAYPYLTSFRDSEFTDGWLLIRDGSVGIRWVTDNHWELGVAGRVQTMGTGTSDDPRLDGIDDRQWGLEIGPVVSWRGWPIHINLSAYAEVANRHDGITSQVTLSWPLEWSGGYFVPSVETIFRDADYTNYYFAVSPAEATPSRPVYQPGSSTSHALKARWGYQLSDKWLLSGGIGLEFLDDIIASSPIVGRDEVWSVRIGLAYNSDVFQPRTPQRTGEQQPRYEFRIGAFSDSVDSRILYDSTAGNPGSEIDLEEVLGLDDSTTVTQLDAIFRFGHYHRMEIGYFQMSRNGLRTLTDDFTFGNETFVASTNVASKFETRLLRVSYAYSLINDDQKELGVMAGVHFPQFKTAIEAAGGGQREASTAKTPLPVIGLHAAIAIGDTMMLGARVQAFRMHFDHYEGTLNYATIDLQRGFGDKLSIGLGYNFYGFNLRSRDNDTTGTLRIRHQGPVLFASMSF